MSINMLRLPDQEISDLFGSLWDTRIFISPGNHDPVVQGSLYASTRWTANVTIFTEPSIQDVFLEDLGVVVYGRGWTSYTERRRVLEGFKSRTDIPSVLVLHGDYCFHGADGNTEYLPISPQDIIESGLTYAALGHVHMPKTLDVGSTKLVYPGAPEPLDFGDTGERGVFLVTIPQKSNGNKARVSAEFIPLCTRQMRVVNIDISLLDTVEKVRNRILSECHRSVRKRDLWRVTLTGKVEADLELDVRILERELAGEFFFLRIIPEYVPNYDFEVLEDPSRTDLEARFVRRLGEIKGEAVASGDGRKERIATLAAYYGLDALRQGKVMFRRRRST